VSLLEVLRSRRYAEAQPAAAVRRDRSRNAVRPVLTTGACMAATLLLVVPLLTLEVDARGGGGHGAADTVPALADTAAGTVAVDTALGMAAADT
jgi:hypothetical protein